MDSVIWHERKALYPLKKKQLSVVFKFVSTLDYHTLLSYEFYFQAQSFLDKQTVAKPTSSTAVSDACVAKLFAYERLSQEWTEIQVYTYFPL